MPKIAIKVEGVSKRYRLGVIGTGTLSRDLNMWWAKWRGKENPYASVEDASAGFTKDEFLALDNLHFEVREGEAVGLIGRNGAGKSTLHKILSRVTKPTKGEIKINGRIASLLEVGTGFHQELTGRENIFLNGAIMGMTKKEIKLKLDEIISFSGVEQYIDTPVKRYSSGMYVRLAFAVAAHLDPDILIVDEVLAVGDAEFQKRCLGKMNDVKREGRTLLFVSHNMGAVRNLCTRGLLLHKGAVFKEGNAEEVINAYLEMNFTGSDAEIRWDLDKAPGTEQVRIIGIRILNSSSKPTLLILDNEEFFIEIDFISLKDGVYLTPNIQLFDANGTWVLSTGNWASVTAGQDFYSNKALSKGMYRSKVKVPALFLNEGMYSVNALIHKDVSTTEVFVQEAISFTIQDTGEMKKEYMNTLTGVVRPRLEWKTSAL